MITFRQFEFGEGLEGVLLVLEAIINKDVFPVMPTKTFTVRPLLDWTKATHFMT